MASACISTDQLTVALTVVHVLSIPWHLARPTINPGGQSEANKIKGVRQEAESADLDAKLAGGKSMSSLLCMVLLSSSF